jgi:hypothetical protein
MNVQLIATTRADEQILERLMQLYAYDFSEFMSLNVDEQVRFAGGTSIAS